MLILRNLKKNWIAKSLAPKIDYLACYNAYSTNWQRLFEKLVIYAKLLLITFLKKYNNNDQPDSNIC
ncbi:hypothetical protein GCW_90959 [Mycoplasmoides gallisepticum S6]|uniref:Uncharacterized protein n=1 Tax=Mycoplasmoides gallisepticum S6 TaxID=1006581 RepID=A0A0F6CLV3_MYCGL|nr:hypothetical protein GCW_90959 [Mycoplasmoides gallisepticum S6]